MEMEERGVEEWGWLVRKEKGGGESGVVMIVPKKRNGSALFDLSLDISKSIYIRMMNEI
jgi:hypothetical protein